MVSICLFFFFSSRRRHTRYWRDWSSDVCSSDLLELHCCFQYCGPVRLHWAGSLDYYPGSRSEERRVGKSVDLGGRRIIKKKKKKAERRASKYVRQHVQATDVERRANTQGRECRG